MPKKKQVNWAEFPSVTIKFPLIVWARDEVAKERGKRAEDFNADDWKATAEFLGDKCGQFICSAMGKLALFNYQSRRGGRKEKPNQVDEWIERHFRARPNSTATNADLADKCQKSGVKLPYQTILNRVHVKAPEFRRKSR